jgi:hypothetical protein
LAALEISARGVKVIAQTSRPVLSPPCFSYPALHNGLLYVRNDDELLCIDLRPVVPDEQIAATEAGR